MSLIGTSLTGSGGYGVRYGQTDTAPLHLYLMNILVYSGEDDSVCATSGTDARVWDLLGNDVILGEYWKDWKVDEQVAGFVSKFKDGVLTYATVHGAGHEVPTVRN